MAAQAMPTIGFIALMPAARPIPSNASPSVAPSATWRPAKAKPSALNHVSVAPELQTERHRD